MGSAILIIDDEVVLAKNLKTYLSKSGYEVMVAHSGEEGLVAINNFQPDLVLLDYHLGEMNGLAVLRKISEQEPAAKVIMITGHGNVEVAVEAMKAGAYDYLSKPVAMAEVKLLIDKALNQEQMENTLAYYRAREAEQSGIGKLLGNSPVMLELKEKLQRIIQVHCQSGAAPGPAILIHGETGTGKELVARALHFDGPRTDKPFVAINCASIPTHLMESELFGFERGAFTDARERKQGLVETAHGGTLFLDEIGEMELSLQAKLLKLLEDRRFRRIGGLRDQQVEIQVISATNRSLQDLVKEGSFRADLFFRLRQIDLWVPPLRERGNDVVLLANAFLAGFCQRYGRTLSFDHRAECALEHYSWPGNVRELRNVVEQAVFLNDSEVISDKLLVQSFVGDAAHISRNSNVCMLCMLEDEFPPEGISLEHLEQDLVAKALRATGWNISQAARLLGLTRDTLRYRIEKYHLQPPE